MKQLTEVEAVWVAGVLEGDGCFEYKKRSDKINSYRTRIRVTQAETRKDLLEKLQELAGGKIYLHRKTGTSHGTQSMFKCTKNHYRWYLGGKRNVGQLLQQILPYLICKEKRYQAEKLLENCNRPHGLSKIPHNPSDLDPLDH